MKHLDEHVRNSQIDYNERFGVGLRKIEIFSTKLYLLEDLSMVGLWEFFKAQECF